MSKPVTPPRDDFDDFARDYGDVLDEHLAHTGAGRDFFARNRVSWVERLESRAGRCPERILDLGCGDGITEVHLEAAFPSARIVGVDVSAESVKVAIERGLSRCDYRAFDGRRVPFADETFDLVFVAGVLHHVPEDAQRRELLGEIYRVLNPGAATYVFEQNPLNPVTRRLVDRCPFDKYARLLSSRELVELMHLAGFDNADIYFILFSPRHRLFTPLHVLEPWLRRLPIGAQYFSVATKPSRRQEAGR